MENIPDRLYVTNKRSRISGIFGEYELDKEGDYILFNKDYGRVRIQAVLLRSKDQRRWEIWRTQGYDAKPLVFRGGKSPLGEWAEGFNISTCLTFSQ